MIIEFKVKNFTSIRDPQTFSLVANASKELEQNNTFSTDIGSLVRSAVIYGANASGKSNLLSALQFMSLFVLLSAKDSQPGEKINVKGFLFDEATRQSPSEFQISFIKDYIRYQYGFTVDENHILEEWLIAYPANGRAQHWFSRIFDKEKDEYAWKFSKLFKSNKIEEITRKEVLFLSNAVKFNNKQLEPIFTWFQKDLIFIDSASRKGGIYKRSVDLINTDEGKNKVLKFMHVADPSIADITVKIEKFSEEKIPLFPSSMPKEVQDFIRKEMMKKDNAEISFTHSGNFSLDFQSESDGTIKLLDHAGSWLDALENGRTLIVDELDNSLHPLVVRFLIQLICNQKANKKNAQLIFTTHDTSLLDTKIFRRDQVWFVEKDKNNATQFYPLTDFSPRKHEAIGAGYLQGRYGALPYIGEWKF